MTGETPPEPMAGTEPTPTTAPTPSTGPMTPSIVYLDVDDEITSAAMRLRTMPADRVVFVLPYGSRLATSRINFRLLAREALANGKRLEIVAPDASARALAGSAGLAVHASVSALEADDGHAANGGGIGSGGPGSGAAAVGPAAGLAAGAAATAPDGTATQVIPVPRTPDPIPLAGRRRDGAGGRRAGLIAILVVALLAGLGFAAYTLLPSATIVLTPATETLGPLQLTVQARPDVTAPDLASLTVPAQTFHFDVQASQSFPATGKNVQDTTAGGNVMFQNCDPSSSVGFPANTLVSTLQGVQFATVSPLSIRKAGFDPVTKQVACRTGSVSIEAVVGGTAGNVAAGTITQLPARYQNGLYFVTNTQPTTGGTHTETPVVTQQDVDGATAQLNQLLSQAFETQINEASGIPAGTTLFESTKLLGPATPSVNPSSLVGQTVQQFELGLTATGTVLGADPAPVRSLADQRLAAQVGQGWQLVPGSTQIDVGQATAGGGSISFPVTATATRVRVVDHDALVAEIRGLVLAQARARLDDYGAVDITLWPDWVSTIPTDTSRISLTIVQTAGAGGSGAPAAPGGPRSSGPTGASGAPDGSGGPVGSAAPSSGASGTSGP